MIRVLLVFLFTLILCRQALAEDPCKNNYSWYIDSNFVVFEIENKTDKKISLTLIEIFTSDKKIFYQYRFEFDEQNIGSYSKIKHLVPKENKIWDYAKTARIYCVDYTFAKQRYDYQKDLQKRTAEYENSIKSNKEKKTLQELLKDQSISSPNKSKSKQFLEKLLK